MTLDIVGALRDKMIGDATLVGLLASYDGAPAIFDAEIVPEDFDENLEPKPSVIITSPTRDDDDGSFTHDARDVDVRVQLYSRPNGSTSDLLVAAECFKNLFRNVMQESFSTGRLDACFVSGPQHAPAEDASIAGRLFILRLFIKEN